MKKVATERRVVRVPVVVEMVPIQHHLVVVLDEIRDVVILDERIECHLFHHPLKFFLNSLGLNIFCIVSHHNAPTFYTKYLHFLLKFLHIPLYLKP